VVGGSVECEWQICNIPGLVVFLRRHQFNFRNSVLELKIHTKKYKEATCVKIISEANSVNLNLSGSSTNCASSLKLFLNNILK
jgi:hypothetical protein